MVIASVCGYLIGFIIGLVLWKIDKRDNYVCCEGYEWCMLTLVVFPILSIIVLTIISTIKLWTLFILGLILAIIVVIYGDTIVDYIKERKCK